MAYSDIILTLVVVAFAVEIVLIDRNLSKITDVITKAFPYNTSPTVEQDEASKTDLLRIQSEVKVLSDLLQEERDRKVVTATTYIRWGREDCSGNTTDLVYSGYVGGSHYSHTGSAVDYVCLPKDPSWGPITDPVTTGYGLMYGAEYENIIVYKVPDLNREVPCAVCRESSYSTTIMIPARTTCYPGWEEAYRGYLSSSHISVPAATQYVCVDENPHTVVGGADTNDDGILLYPVRTRCGSLK